MTRHEPFARCPICRRPIDPEALSPECERHQQQLEEAQSDLPLPTSREW